MTKRRAERGARRPEGLPPGFWDELASIEIRPEPSPAEREAILAAVTTALGGMTEWKSPVISPWTAAGRREALRPHGDDGASGWLRGRSASR